MRLSVIIGKCLLCAALISAAVSCDTEVPAPDEELQEGCGTVTLSFKMLTSESVAGTRADSEGHDETGSEYLNFEEGIDSDDLGLLVFAKLEDSSDEYMNLLDNLGTATAFYPQIRIAGAPGEYVVTADIKISRLAELIGGRLSPENNANVSFRVIVLANCSSSGTGGTGNWRTLHGKSCADVLSTLKSKTYPLAYVYNSSYDGEDLTLLYKNAKEHMPMFGMGTFSVTQRDLYYSRPEEHVYFGELYLLRALAKVRVVDNIPKNAEGYPKITGASVFSSQVMLRQLPADIDNYINGRQVHSPNIVDPDPVLSLSEDRLYRLGAVPDEWDMTPAGKKTGTTRIGYIPEQKIGCIDPAAPDKGGMPAFRVTVAFSSEETRQYDVPMTEYDGSRFKFDFGDYILRNHIYTLSVNQAADMKIYPSATVMDWTPGNDAEATIM